ncbi:MAG: type II toxin-antitoxin system VapC family toxin, partial [Microcoleus sp. SIO2G3]|nr:type II toxin-antitoxin system VapC family toxin [Microcoleus sp. SIO2G3]
MTVVLDASALLAYFQDEPGGEAIQAMLAESVIS